MLRSIKEIEGYPLEATDGRIGSVKDFYFDDRAWAVRYLVADTARWLPGRKVLISPVSLGQPDWDEHVVPVSLDKKQIELSPSIDAERPVSRQHEIKLVGYYGWPIYWAPAGIPAVGMMPARVAPQYEPTAEGEPATNEEVNPSLRSTDEVRGYHIQASDDSIGHVEDFIVQTDGWAIRYLVVDTRNWLPGRHVLLSPAWIDRISYPRREVFVQMSQEEIRNSPEYDPSQPVNRDYEARLHDYYGRPRYWEEAARQEKESKTHHA